MKTKLIAVLVFAMLICLFSACESKGDKWVLTKEVKQYSDEYDTSTIAYEKTFEYDEKGQIVAEKETNYDSDVIYSSCNFKYNDDGFLTAKAVKANEGTATEQRIRSYEYGYDSYGNCVSEKVEILQDPDATYYIEYVYDKMGSVIEENYKDNFLENSYAVSKTKRLTYEDEKCIQAEVTTITDDNKASFSVEQFVYDENGNLTQKLFYEGVEKSSEAKAPLTIENRSYRMEYAITYTYEKLK